MHSMDEALAAAEQLGYPMVVRPRPSPSAGSVQPAPATNRAGADGVDLRASNY
ncbi:hypothetical protein QJS66_03925 [Kocuria rhizophila]|nr:hypothetical protein QJS66_03925 [Kocuria rhizophila]